MPKEMREIVIQPPVTMESLTTDTPDRQYYMFTFFEDWVLGSVGMQTEENIPHLIEWDDAIRSITKKHFPEKSRSSRRLPPS